MNKGIWIAVSKAGDYIFLLGSPEPVGITKQGILSMEKGEGPIWALQFG